MTLVFINPGHSANGQPDAGAVYNGTRECDIAAKIAAQLEKLLQFNGFTVLTYQQTGYNNDSNKQLNSVASKANTVKADIFISIHMNGFTSPDAKGTETWYMNGSKTGQKLAELMNKELSSPYKSYTLVNRGAKVDQRGLAVLKYTNMPAVLTEIGFISNKAECQFINDNVAEIAERICKSICEYFGQKYKTEDSNTLAITGNNKEFRISPSNNGKYNCYVDNELKLKDNKLSTCLEWIVKNYQV